MIDWQCRENLGDVIDFRSYDARDASEFGGGETAVSSRSTSRGRGGQGTVYRGDKAEAVVRQVWARGYVLLLLEYRVLRLSLPTIALAVTYADVFTTTDVHDHRHLRFRFQHEHKLANAGDAQTCV